MIRVSVIVPVYKTEQYIHRCIDSILNQTFTDFELILVDDGSPDNCPAICDKYAQKDSRIRVLHKENGGVSRARNEGVKIARGEYITFVDADDYVHSEFLNVLYSAIKDNEAEISVVHQYRENENGDAKPLLYSGKDAVCHFATINDDRFRAPWGKLIHKTILWKHPFPTDRSYAEDMGVVYKWYWAANRVVEIDRGLYFYTINDEGVTLRNYGIHRLGNIKTLNEMLAFLKQQGLKQLYERKLEEYLYQLFWQCQELMKIGEEAIAKRIKAELRLRLKTECSVSVEKYPQYFEFIYPKTMCVYWTAKGIIAKAKTVFKLKER